MRCMQDLADIIATEGLKKIGVIGIGGVMSPEDAKSYLDSGADVVQATTAFFVDSYFGIGVRGSLDSQLRSSETSAEQEEDVARLNCSKAVGELKRELGGDERSVESVGLEVLLNWETKQKSSVGVLARRRGPVPRVEDFKKRIRNRLAAR